MFNHPRTDISIPDQHEIERMFNNGDITGAEYYELTHDIIKEMRDIVITAFIIAIIIIVMVQL
jgi:hypothetical protein